jgi:hypothetical protein
MQPIRNRLVLAALGLTLAAPLAAQENPPAATPPAPGAPAADAPAAPGAPEAPAAAP